MTLEVRSRARPSKNERCPYCHDRFELGECLLCQQCKARYHKDCVTACVSLGCQGELEVVRIELVRMEPLKSGWLSSTKAQEIGSACLLLSLVLGVIAFSAGPLAFAWTLPALLVVLAFITFWVAIGLLSYASRSKETSSVKSVVRVVEEPKVEPLLVVEKEKKKRPSKENFYARPNIAPPTKKTSKGVSDRQRQIERRRTNPHRPGLGRTI